MALQVTVYLVVFSTRDSALNVLVARRNGKNFRSRTGILGVTLRPNESFEEAARRNLAEHVGGDHHYLEQLYCSVEGKTKRSRGSQAFTIAYYALLPADRAFGVNGARWSSINSLTALSPAHRRIVSLAVRRLRRKVEHNTAGFHLLSRKFTLPELQGMYEAILGRKLDKRNFRKKMGSLGLLRPLRQWRRTGRKPARLYAVATRRLQKLEESENIRPT